jgi:hypothetical protein
MPPSGIHKEEFKDSKRSTIPFLSLFDEHTGAKDWCPVRSIKDIMKVERNCNLRLRFRLSYEIMIL